MVKFSYHSIRRLRSVWSTWKTDSVCSPSQNLIHRIRQLKRGGPAISADGLLPEAVAVFQKYLKICQTQQLRAGRDRQAFLTKAVAVSSLHLKNLCLTGCIKKECMFWLPWHHGFLQVKSPMNKHDIWGTFAKLFVPLPKCHKSFLSGDMFRMSNCG